MMSRWLTVLNALVKFREVRWVKGAVQGVIDG
jgi:hypothetical protein